MRPTFRLFHRGKIYYAEHATTGRQVSLRTSDRNEAERLLTAKNESVNPSSLTLAIGKTYLAAIDPESLTRTWTAVMDVLCRRGGPNTRERSLRATRSGAFNLLRDKKILQTTADDLLLILADGKSSTRHYLKLLQNLATDLGWLACGPVLARRCWPTILKKSRRAITREEHCKIVATEASKERGLYYELLWETGASQTDAASLTCEQISWAKKQIVYRRVKTCEQAVVTIGSRLEQLLLQLPNSGPLFPILKEWSSCRRAAEFYRRTRILNIEGVSLHSYRYAWAERAYQAGYPERYAQAALGHGSRVVHHAYARSAKVNCPALEDYESPPQRH